MMPLLFAAALFAADAPADLQPKTCDYCEAWNAKHAPVRLHGETFYVGPEGLAVVLIRTPEGAILLDGGLPQSVPLIEANLESLGVALSEVKWIVNSHAHYDHAGGIAALARLTGAKVAASHAGAKALRLGGVTPDDPQAGLGEAAMAYPPVKDVVEIDDGGTITLGGITLTAHYTPGHTPGATTWTWRSCEKDQCIDAVYADSLNAVSAEGFRFDSPERLAQFRASIARIRELPCDLVVSVHPAFVKLFERIEARQTAAKDPLLEGGCRAYADDAEKRLDKRLADEAHSPN